MLTLLIKVHHTPQNLCCLPLIFIGMQSTVCMAFPFLFTVAIIAVQSPLSFALQTLCVPMQDGGCVCNYTTEGTRHRAYQEEPAPTPRQSGSDSSAHCRTQSYPQGDPQSGPAGPTGGFPGWSSQPFDEATVPRPPGDVQQQLSFQLSFFLGQIVCSTCILTQSGF